MTARRHAFTLIEVMIALALIGMLAGSMFAFLWSLSSRQQDLSATAGRSQAIDAFLDRLEGDLLGGIAGDARLGAGIQGDAERLRLLSRGVELADGGAGDLQESVFQFAGGTLSLSRRPVGGDAAEPRSYPVSAELSRVRFRFFDGRTWKSSFDSGAAGKLPAAIEVAVWRAGRAPAAAGGGETPGAWPEPDRLRVIVVPDGPDAAWGGGEKGGSAP